MKIDTFKFRHLLISALFFVFLLFSALMLLFIASTPSIKQEAEAIDKLTEKLEAQGSNESLASVNNNELNSIDPSSPQSVQTYNWAPPPDVEKNPDSNSCYLISSPQLAAMEAFLKALSQAGTQAALNQKMKEEVYALSFSKNIIDSSALNLWTQKHLVQSLPSKENHLLKFTAPDRKTLETAYLDLPLPIQQKTTLTLISAPQVVYYTTLMIPSPQILENVQGYIQKSRELTVEPTVCN